MDKDKKNGQSHNLQNYVCYTFPEYFVLEYTKKKDLYDQTAKVLKIDRKTFEVRELSKSEVDFTHKDYMIRSFSSFLGLVSMHSINFLLFCEDCIEVFNNPDSNFQVFEISSIFLVCALNDQELILSGKKRSVLSKITMLNELLSRGFYYSHNYNLTQSMQFQQAGFRDEFTWNRRYLTELRRLNSAISSIWTIPVIQGYVSHFNCFVEGTQVHYYLISRRSCEKGGTRYFDRGVNEHGFVANFVESQQIILISDKYAVSDVQVRGSVPIYFEQKGIRTKVNINRSFELTRTSFQQHFKYLSKRYHRTLCVNLLAQNKKGQNRITLQYQKHIRQSSPQKVKYMYFDFHKQCHGNNFSMVNPAVVKIKDMKKNMQFYVFDKQAGTVIQRQMGVLRTNCLDCLDRTNFFQAKAALLTVQQIFYRFGIDLAGSFGCSCIEEMDKKDTASFFIKQFKSLWADNGDQISFHYTGTGSTHTDVTRGGSRDFRGIFTHKMKTITRFYNQNFSDFHKMKMVDLILQNSVSSIETDRIPSMLKERQKEFCEFTNLTVTVFTWKLSNCSIPKEPLNMFGSDIVVIGFQEVESGTSVFNYSHSSGSRVDQWKKYLAQKCLGEQYMEMSQSYHSNNLCLIYIKRHLKTRVSSIQTSYVKFSSYFNTYLSNKCAVLLRFKVDDTSLAFASCQLQYGKSFSKNRVFNMREIFKCAFQEEEVGKKKGDLLENTVYKFIFGNLNTNLNMDEENSKSQIKNIIQAYAAIRSLADPIEKEMKTKTLKQLITELIQHDDSAELRESCEYFRQFEEGVIDFIPPYKYVKGKAKMDESKTPGWVDRIFYDTEEPVKCLSYNVAELFVSDHLPVHGTFEVRVTKEDDEKKEATYNSILEELKVSKPEPDSSQEDEENGS